MNAATPQSLPARAGIFDSGSNVGTIAPALVPVVASGFGWQAAAT